MQCVEDFVLRKTDILDMAQSPQNLRIAILGAGAPILHYPFMID